MRATARRVDVEDDLLAAYVEHCEHLDLPAARRQKRINAARRFLERHGDVGTWMRKPLEAHLVDLDRLEGSWPLVGFALLTGRVSADIDFLAAKHAGHTFARAMAAISPADLAELRQAARRLEWAEPWERSVLSEALPLAVAFTGKPPRHLSIEDLEALRGAIKTTPYYTASVRHAKSSYVHSLGRLLYEARFVDRPPVHRRGEGPGNLASRLSVVGLTRFDGHPPTGVRPREGCRHGEQTEASKANLHAGVQG